MPVFFQHQINEYTRLGVWKIEEGWESGRSKKQKISLKVMCLSIGRLRIRTKGCNTLRVVFYCNISSRISLTSLFKSPILASPICRMSGIIFPFRTVVIMQPQLLAVQTG